MREPFHLGALPVGAKVTLTAFLALIGCGYLVAVGNIYVHHHEADLEPGLGLDDLRRVYHGIEKTIVPGVSAKPVPHMLKAVSPGGIMRKYLEKGGEPAIRTLMAWLEGGSREPDFTRDGIAAAGDPSPQTVIAEHCVKCHNPAGEKSDIPYAEDRDSLPTFALVSKEALPEAMPSLGPRVVKLEPMGFDHLVQVTHVHIISIPMFTLVIAGLFLLTGQSARVKTLLTPVPMLAVCLDISSWWLARPFEPFVYAIAAAGAVFGTTLALQIFCILGALWLGRPPPGHDRAS